MDNILAAGNQTGQKISGLRSVHFYTASPVESCDRCAAAIKHVALVTWKDGTSRKFGSECINKILAGDTSLKNLFNRNRKLATKYAAWAEVLRRAPEAMPRGSEYYGSGLFFIADDAGDDIGFNGRWIFHPAPDWEKNQGGDAYRQRTLTQEAYRAARMGDVAKQLAWLEVEMARIEGFLARILAKGLAA